MGAKPTMACVKFWFNLFLMYKWCQKKLKCPLRYSWIASQQRSLHSLLFSVWSPYGMGGFQTHSMDWTWTIFWLATQPICYSMLTMESIWNTYGMVPSICNPWTGPCGFHGISNEFELQIHVLFRMDSMEAKSVDKPIKWAAKNSVSVRNRTLDLVNVSRVQV